MSNKNSPASNIFNICKAFLFYKLLHILHTLYNDINCYINFILGSQFFIFFLRLLAKL